MNFGDLFTSTRNKLTRYPFSIRLVAFGPARHEAHSQAINKIHKLNTPRLVACWCPLLLACSSTLQTHPCSARPGSTCLLTVRNDVCLTFKTHKCGTHTKNGSITRNPTQHTNIRHFRDIPLPLEVVPSRLTSTNGHRAHGSDVLLFVVCLSRSSGDTRLDIIDRQNIVYNPYCRENTGRHARCRSNLP